MTTNTNKQIQNVRNLLVKYVKDESSVQLNLHVEFKLCGLIPNEPTLAELESFDSAIKNDLAACELLTKAEISRVKNNILKKVYYSMKAFCFAMSAYPEMATQLKALQIKDLYKFYIANVADCKGLGINETATIRIKANGEFHINKPSHKTEPAEGVNRIGTQRSEQVILAEARKDMQQQLIERLEALNKLSNAKDIHKQINAWLTELNTAAMQA